MSDYLVNPADIVRIMEELTADNETLAGRIEQLRQLQSELTGIWEGEAEQSFQSTMTNDISALESYHSLVQQYCLALQDIAAVYVETELDNLEKIES